MKIYQGVEHFPKLTYPVVTSGTFDGVHIGHQKILQRIAEITNNFQGESVLITFWPHPRTVLFPENHNLKLLSSFDEKAALLEQFGINHLVQIPFTQSFSKLTSEAFVQNYLVNKINTKKLVIGYDHRFGRNREGSFEYLARNAPRYGFEVEEIPKQDLDHVAISSTIIRKALQEGDVLHANSYLGRTYGFEGLVVDGKQIGRTIGFPTANLRVTEPLKLIPADGSYAVRVKIAGHSWQGMMNIGMRPTIDGKNRTIEVHIFQFNEKIYGEKIIVEIVARIRNEMKFDSVDDLKNQLKMDKEKALALLAH